jgi:membrane dipeptidase
MKPKHFAPCFLLFASLAFAQTHPSKKISKAASAHPKTDAALAIHQSAIIIDTHADTPQRFLDENFDLGQNTPVFEGHIDLGKIKQGNLGAEFFSIWVEPEFKGHYAKRAMDLIDSVYQQAARHPDKMTMAFTADDIVHAHDQHKFAALMGIEGGHAIENDIRLLRDFYRMGVRYMTLTWSNTNEWADSSGDVQDPNVKHHNGITDFGKDVVHEMNRLGMIVDISHVSDATFYQALQYSQAPVIASHSSARELTNQPRNMTDDMLHAMTNNGGVVMVNFYSAFIDENYRKASSDPEKIKQRDAEVEAYKKAHPHQDGSPVGYNETVAIEKKWAAQFPRPPLKSLIDHIDHIAKVAGIDHVGLGSDFDGVTSLPEGIDSVADLPKITQALYERGYTREQIQKVLGGNFLRVMREVEAKAKQLQQERKESAALSFKDIELMLANRTSTAEIIQRINQNGVNFGLTTDNRMRLKTEKTDDGVLEAIAKAKRNGSLLRNE